MSEETQERTTDTADERAFNPKRYLTDYMGRAYLDVAHRLLWLNDQHDQFTVDTELLHYGEDFAVVKAVVAIQDEQGKELRRAVGHGQARRGDMPRHIAARFLEKAETAAVGRALGMLGLGTLTAQEFDDTEHLADSPAEPTPLRGNQQQSRNTMVAQPDDDDYICADCGRQVSAIQFRDGSEWSIEKMASVSKRKYGVVLEMDCYRKRNAAAAK